MVVAAAEGRTLVASAKIQPNQRDAKLYRVQYRQAFLAQHREAWVCTTSMHSWDSSYTLSLKKLAPEVKK